MSQTVLAISALACIAFLSLNTRRAGHHLRIEASKAEIEARAASVGSEFLDLAATLPFHGLAAPGVDLKAASSLDAWNGRATSVTVPAGEDSLRFVVKAAVEPVGKLGDRFEPTLDPTPFRRLRLSVEGEQGAAVSVERVYSEAVR